ncbi:MAG: restriction endonuclease subunit S [Nitrososphaerota archaeon]|nr:restriction endonuclease subunit S [Nitrososphaerota archaeon]
MSTFSRFVKKGIFDLPPDLYRDFGVPLIRTSEIKNPVVDFSSTVFVDEETQNLNRKTELKAGDIVFTKIGANIGDVAILPTKYDRYNFSQNVAGLKVEKGKVKSGFLLAYLLSKYGNRQIRRSIMLSGQGKLELEDVKNIKVILLDDSVRELTHGIVARAEFLNETSIDIYRQAEQILLSELALSNWKPKHRLSYIKDFSATEDATRIDAEYFQPMYDDILETVRGYKYGFDSTGALFRQNMSPIKIKSEESYEYVEISSISPSSGEIETLDLSGKDLPANAKIKLSKGYLLISKVRTYRGGIAIVQHDGLVGSGAFTVLEESEKINKETAFVYFKSSPILRLSLKYNAGTSYPVIDDSDILNMPFPLIPVKLQQAIKSRITEMYRARAMSKRFLETAKHGVEIAIERSEKEAEKWMNKELQATEPGAH